MLTSGKNLGGQFNPIGQGRFALGHCAAGCNCRSRLAGDGGLDGAIAGKPGSYKGGV